jgi:hypothetical protein
MEKQDIDHHQAAGLTRPAASRLLAALLLSFVALVGTSQAQDPPLDKDGIIDRAWTAMFGELERDEVRSLYIETADGNQLTVQRPGLFRNVHDGGILVFDGRRAAWAERVPDEDGNPRGPEMIGPESWVHFEVDIALLFPAFFDHPSELRGLQRVGEDVFAWELFVELPMGGTVSYFVDAGSYQVVKRMVNWEGNPTHFIYDQTIPGHTQYDSVTYPEGYIYPTREGPQTLLYTNVELNRDTPEELFRIPDMGE